MLAGLGAAMGGGSLGVFDFLKSSGSALGSGFQSGLSSAGSGLFDTIFGGITAKRQWKYRQKEMELQQQYALDQMQKQFDLQRMVFDYTNEYNDPKNVIARNLAAGINPQAAIGGSIGIGSMPSGPSSAGTPSSSFANPSSGLNAGDPNQSQLVDSQRRVNDTQADKNVADTQVSETNVGLIQSEILTNEAIIPRIASETQVNLATAALRRNEALIAEWNAKAAPARIQADFDKVKAETNLLIGQLGCTNEQAALLKRQQSTQVAMAAYYWEASRAQGSQSELFKSQAAYYGCLGTDLYNQIQTSLQEHEMPVLIFNEKTHRLEPLFDEETGEPIVRRLSPYDARALQDCYAAWDAEFISARNRIVAGWEESNQQLNLQMGLAGIAHTNSDHVSQLIQTVIRTTGSLGSAAMFGKGVGNAMSRPSGRFSDFPDYTVIGGRFAPLR